MVASRGRGGDGRGRFWIAAGAEYQPHWSFITPKRPELPRVQNRRWVRNPIDAFNPAFSVSSEAT